MTFRIKGKAERMKDIDLPRIGSVLGVGEDEIHALIDVEAAGGGFNKDGSLKFRFEPHYFYNRLNGSNRAMAVEQGLAWKGWQKNRKYPANDWTFLKRAIDIDSTAALKSCSWGAPQIMGANHRAAGYGTVEEMVEAFADSEAAQLMGMVNFIISEGIDDDLRAHRWEAFAARYNGPRHAEHNYAGKLKARYDWWAKIPDTPYDPKKDGTVATKKADIQPTVAMAPYKVKALQERLRDLGYFEVGKVDGIWGSRTTGALAAFQAEEGLPVSGALDPATDEKLAVAGPRKVSDVRSTATADDLAQQGSRTVTEARDINWAQWFQIGTAVVAALAYALQNYATTDLPFGFSTILSVSGIPYLAIIAQIGFAFYTRLKASGVIDNRVQAERMGLHNGEPQPVSRPANYVPPGWDPRTGR